MFLSASGSRGQGSRRRSVFCSQTPVPFVASLSRAQQKRIGENGSPEKGDKEEANEDRKGAHQVISGGSWHGKGTPEVVCFSLTELRSIPMFIGPR